MPIEIQQIIIEMTRKQKIVLRLNILYLLFFGIILVATVSSLFSQEFSAGFREGFESTQRTSRQPGYTFVDIPIQREAGVYDINIRQDSNLRLNARITSIDVRVSGSEIDLKRTLGSLIVSILALLCYISILIIILVMLTLLRKSIRTGNIFNGNNIGFIRAIGLLLIIGSLLWDWSRYIELQSLENLLQSPEWKITKDIFTFRDIIMGVITLIIAEIFAIGHDIAEDQQLTI